MMSKPLRANIQCTLLLSLCLLLPGPPAQAEDPSAKQAQAQQLRALRTRLEALQKNLDKTRGERDALRDDLRDSEREIGSLLNNLRDLDKQITNQNSRLTQLQNQKAQEHRQIQGQISALETEARAAYLLGRQEYIKLLLNQQDPASVSRSLIYYRYLQQARAARIQKARNALTQLQSVEKNIQQQTLDLKKLHAQQSQKKNALAESRGRREEILAKLNREVSSQSQEVERLKRDEQRLTGLIQEIRDYLAEAPQNFLPGPNARFASERGRLPIPVQGRIAARYGSPKNVGDLNWRGLFIAAPEGRPVVAVFHGRVAYADWLRGFGLLMIVEHGDGYMTLYGHNQTLHKRAGDWVEAGQTIASVGSTGGPPEAGLYFELRHNGDPRDPLQWCRLR